MRETLNSIHHVVKASSHVRVSGEAIIAFAKRLRDDEIRVPPWDRQYHFHEKSHDMVSYLLVLDTLNFCFWAASRKKKWEIIYGSSRLSGYYGLAASLKRAVEMGIPITRAEFLTELSLDTLKAVLGGRGELQLMERRVEILNELGCVLVESYDGEASRLVETAGGSTEKLVRSLAETLSSFRDVAEYLGQRVYFYKRAQIFCADLYGAFEGTRWGRFEDIDQLTAFADYKLPQVLRHLGILHYDEALAERIDRKIPLEAGSPEEIEIRASAVWAVELIRGEMMRLGRSLRAFEVDWILWNLGQQAEFKARPHHRTVTMFY